MKINKNMGKVHPSPSSSVSSSSTTKDSISALRLLPAAILALISVLSLEDKEATANLSFLLKGNTRKCRKGKKQLSPPHKPPLFGYGCFDCYTSYWIRWDSSPNRELIHQAIEAFEEHLATGELQSLSKMANGRGKRRERMTGRRRLSGSLAAEDVSVAEAFLQEEEAEVEAVDPILVVKPPGNVAENGGGSTSEDLEKMMEIERVNEDGVVQAEATAEEAALGVVPSPAGGNHKGLARKVLPDVIGLLNSRLWNLWNPNV
ncbi:hypothetical protein Ancab_018243 [Ancistrocladus abbreviatus]